MRVPAGVEADWGGVIEGHRLHLRVGGRDHPCRRDLAWGARETAVAGGGGALRSAPHPDSTAAPMRRHAGFSFITSVIY